VIWHVQRRRRLVDLPRYGWVVSRCQRFDGAGRRSGMRLVSRGIAVGFLCTSMLCALPASSEALLARPARPSAAVPAHYRLTALAGSSKFFVYSKFGVYADGRRAHSGALFVKQLHGKSHRIAMITSAFGNFSIDRSMLVYGQGEGPNTATQHVYWRSLSTGAHGSFVSPVGAFAAPNGWVTAQQSAGPSSAYVLSLHTTTGRTTRLGSPDPAGSTIDISVGGDTLVVYEPFPDSGSNGAVKWMSFSRPGKFHQLISTPQGDSSICRSVTSKYIACNYSDNTADTNRLYTVTGKLVVSTAKDCTNGPPAVVGDSIMWVTVLGGSCPVGRTTFLSPTGKVSFAKGNNLIGIPVSAFGKIVIASRSPRKLVLVSSATQRRVFVQTH
jgi:hypothetical protein